MIAVRALAAAALLLLGQTSCLSSSSTTPASVVVPADPTPLAKCKVAKSQASPLVTEWPASEKAHLEGMLSDQAVVVSYSGCEMRLLEACKLTGNYKFKRTTLANDVIEIESEDDLYAKIPLGAASLEGELARSGRLAVKTTVAGQLRLDADLATLPQNAACKDATHVVSALSIGAFELTSGGAVSGRAGVDVAGAGAGIKHGSEESSLRSAGDPKACSKKGDAPDPECSSPLQVFLVPVEGAGLAANAEVDRLPQGDRTVEPEEEAEPPPAKRTRPREPEPDPDKSIEMHFALPDDGGRWMLLRGDGVLLCELPCVRRVAPNSGYKLQLDADQKDDIKVVAVPADLGYSPGRRVRAVPQPAVNNEVGAWLFYGGIVAALTGGIVAGTLMKDGGEDEKCREAGCIASWTVGGVGAAAAIGGGIWWYGTKEEEGLDMTLMTEGSAIVRPTVTMDFGPGWVSGRF